MVLSWNLPFPKKEQGIVKFSPIDLGLGNIIFLKLVLEHKIYNYSSPDDCSTLKILYTIFLHISS